MPSLGMQLEQARDDVTQVRGRIEAQTALIERLKSDGHDTGAAERLLATFLDLMTKLSMHRDTLEREAEERSHTAN